MTNSTQAGPATKTTDEVFPDSPPIPRRMLFSNPDRHRVQLSPDGRRLSFLAPVDGVNNIWGGAVDAPDDARPITDDAHRGILHYRWAYTGDHLIYAQDHDGNENWTLYAVDLVDGEHTRLTPACEDVQAYVLQTSPDHPEQLLVQFNDRDPRFHDIHRVDITTGEADLVLKNTGFSAAFADSDLRVRLVSEPTDEGGKRWWVPDPNADDTPDFPDRWRPVADIPMEDAFSTDFRGFDRNGDTGYAVDSRGRDTAALVALDFESGERTVLHADERADVVELLRHPADQTVQAATVEYEHREWTVLDEAIADDFERLAELDDGQMDIATRTVDDRLWLAKFQADDGPARWWLYDTDGGDAQFLFTDRPRLEELQLSAMHPVVIEARDRLQLVSYLTVPHFAPTNAEGMPVEPLPTVLLVHGGPWWRDRFGYHPWHQWLADRGYAVLSVNFRGSIGFGKDFLNAGNREWGGRMHDDLIDGVDWAVENGIADPDRVAIMGGSYGGYATLVGLTFTPKTFACGVCMVGVANLLTFLDALPPYWEHEHPMWKTRVGDFETEEGREFLRRRSPLFRADQIERPLLLGHGANDPRVDQEESDQIAEAMKTRGVPVTYAVYPDEGHSFVRPENRFSFYALTEAFLAEHIGGRFEPVGDDFDGSSIELVEGAGQVAGITGTLQR